MTPHAFVNARSLANRQPRTCLARTVMPLVAFAVLTLSLNGASAFGAASARQASPPVPPTQPAAGAGGADYRFAAVDARRVGAPPDGFWLFTPRFGADAAGERDGVGTLPVIVFLHGLNALDPVVYRGWIDHLVRRGAYVVYPDVHPANSLAEPWSTFLGNLERALLAARAELADDAGPPPDWSRLAVVGHSLGGALAVAYTASAAGGDGESGAPPIPSAVAAIQPGGCQGCGGLTNERGVPLPDLSAIDPETRVLVVTADADTVVGDRPARVIWRGLSTIPNNHRDYARLRGDRHGAPPLVADHLLSLTAGPGAQTDALDWYGTWKLVDLLLERTFTGGTSDDAAGDADAQRTMGSWSDGVPVTTILVGDDPDALAEPPPALATATPDG